MEAVVLGVEVEGFSISSLYIVFYPSTSLVVLASLLNVSGLPFLGSLQLCRWWCSGSVRIGAGGMKRISAYFFSFSDRLSSFTPAIKQGGVGNSKVCTMLLW